MSETDAKKTDEVSTAEQVEKYVRGFAETAACPEALKPHLTKAAPFVGKAAAGLEKAAVMASDLYDLALVQYEKLRPYRPELLLPSLLGLIMCFFGGSFLTLIAAVEAYRLVGFETTLSCLQQLRADFEKVVDASRKDDARDDDNDGVRDVRQISHRALLQRKAALFLRTVDPQRVAAALGGLQAGFLAVVATLKLSFARSLTLGQSLADAVEPPVDRILLPLLEKVVPLEYVRWVRPVLSYTVRATCVSVAWTLQRVLSALHSAVRGGLLFSRNLLAYLSEMGIYKVDHEATFLDEIVGGAVALLGLLFQLSRGFSLPFPLNLLLFPFSLVEYLLLWAISA